MKTARHTAELCVVCFADGDAFVSFDFLLICLIGLDRATIGGGDTECDISIGFGSDTKDTRCCAIVLAVNDATTGNLGLFIQIVNYIWPTLLRHVACRNAGTMDG